MTQDNPYAPPKSPIAPESNVPADELARRGDRLLASIIDSFLLFIPWMIVMFATGYWDRLTSMEFGSIDQLATAFIGILLYVILNGYHLNYYGQTLGKRVVGIRVVSFDNNEILPLWKLLALRFLPLSIVSSMPGLGSFASFVDSLFIFRSEKRCVHDLIANTKVVVANAPWKHADGELGAS
jgi:uncharacterized RDD family membrane protein YckC